MNKIIIYTDGSSKGNPGPGGWAAVIIENNYSGQGELVREIGGKAEQTTNNRMEMAAAIKALQNIPALQQVQGEKIPEIEMHTDSEYLMKGITIWIKNWQRNNWRTKNKKEVLNKDLWQELWKETQKRKVEWKKVLGHSGHEFNERCDEIATSFADGKKVLLYKGFRDGYLVFH
jgi:ribonuclease HI